MLVDEAVKFVKHNKNYFPHKKTDFLICKLIECKNVNVELVYGVKLIRPLKVLAISIFLGMLGLDRFLINDKFFGFLKLFTFGGFGLLMIFDWFYISKRVKEINYSNLLGICYYNNHNF